MDFLKADHAISYALEWLTEDGGVVDPGTWQGIKTDVSMVTQELMNLQLEFPIPLSADEAIDLIKPNMPWAEDHFQERVSRDPSNPGKEYKNWPWWRGQDHATLHHGSGSPHPQFSHTYQERFWPKWAGMDKNAEYSNRYQQRGAPGYKDRIIEGIRYRYGDLDDVVGLLRREPQTRQATFPVFFPEDTGAVHGGRIPCTLHYHFLLRNGKLHLWYPIRSCDAVRHFRDDLYMACRLCHWVLQELTRQCTSEDASDEDFQSPWVTAEPGMLHFTAYSFHVHMGDRHLL